MVCDKNVYLLYLRKNYVHDKSERVGRDKYNVKWWSSDEVLQWYKIKINTERKSQFTFSAGKCIKCNKCIIKVYVCIYEVTEKSGVINNTRETTRRSRMRD